MNTMAGKGNPNTRSGVVQGLISAWPICLGYIPVGLALRIPGTPYQSGLLQIRYYVPRIPWNPLQNDVSNLVRPGLEKPGF